MSQRDQPLPWSGEERSGTPDAVGLGEVDPECAHVLERLLVLDPLGHRPDVKGASQGDDALSTSRRLAPLIRRSRTSSTSTSR